VGSSFLFVFGLTLIVRFADFAEFRSSEAVLCFLGMAMVTAGYDCIRPRK